MLTKVADKFSEIIKKYLPDAFVIAVGMTILVIVLGILMNLNSPMEIVKAWGDGFWKYLGFTMQMVLMLMTGMVLAAVPGVRNFLQSIASWASTPKKAYVMTFLVSAAAYYINWGLAVVVGAIFAREIGRRNSSIHFPLLVAAAYAPTTLYTAGLSSSIGLTIATPGHFLAEQMGVIPTSETIFSAPTIIILLTLVITMPIFIYLMAPKKNIVSFNPGVDKGLGSDTETVATTELELTPASRMENSKLVGWIIGGIGIIYVVYEFATGRGLDLNIINITFLSLGLFFHGSLMRFYSAFRNAAESISPLILQFPFYAGIIAVLSSSGLGELIIRGISSIGTADTFPMLTYWAAGIVNILAPSGGGQWALQGPLQVPAGMALGVDPGAIAMAVGWGDAWTNLIQPFWALPILGVVGLGIKDIMGYCILLSVWVGFITSVLLLMVY